MKGMLYWRWRDCVDMIVAPACFDPPIYMSAWPLERWFYGLLGWLYLNHLWRHITPCDEPRDFVMAAVWSAGRAWGPE